MNGAMQTRDYDVLIVGARCAGATLAIYLARAGAKVLLLDKDALPSDHVLSTHSINPPGMDVLDEVGVGDAVRAVSPPTRVIRANVEGQSVDVELPADRPAYCPRRRRLDDLLQRAAVAAGAQLLDRTRAVSFWEDDGRVRGVRAITGGAEHVYTAGLIVGADGRHSSVARGVGAEEYLGYDAPRATYWGYWDAPKCWHGDPAYGFDMYFALAGGVLRAIFQTDGDQLLIASSPPVERIGPFRSDPLGALVSSLNQDPLIAGLIRDAAPSGKVIGTVKERFFFRRAAGPGWVLVGDAGLHKEYALGDGITEALLQARSLAAAIAEGTDASLVRWWRERDVAALPLYYLGQMTGALDAPVELQRMLFANLAAEPAMKTVLADVIERRLSPFDALPASLVLRGTMDALVRGRWGVIGEILQAGRHAFELNREMRARLELLARAQASESLSQAA